MEIPNFLLDFIYRTELEIYHLSWLETARVSTFSYQKKINPYTNKLS
jgi:hypothetical protein